MANEDKKTSQKPATDGQPSSEGAPPGTEATVKGGSEPAKREAEKDWHNSSKEAGD